MAALAIRSRHIHCMIGSPSVLGAHSCVTTGKILTTDAPLADSRSQSPMPAKLSEKEVLKRFADIHGTEYDYSRVHYASTHVPVEIVCRTHGNFWQSPSAHIAQKQGCPKCSRGKASKKRRIPFSEFEQRAQRLHADAFTYHEKHYHGLQRDTLIICKAHSRTFRQRPAVHLMGCTGCTECVAHKLRVPRLSKKEWRRRIFAAHGNTYRYEQFGDTLKSHDKITITCRRHGRFLQPLGRHADGAGCPQCAGVTPLGLGAAEAIGAKYGVTLLSTKYKNYSDPLLWQCAHGHKWKYSLGTAKDRGLFCPECIGGRYFGEELVRAYFELVFSMKFPNSFPSWGRGLQLDGYCDSLDLAFEHHGRQHFTFVRRYHRTENGYLAQRRRDVQKRRLCKKHGVRLLEISSVPDQTALDALPLQIDNWCQRHSLPQHRSAASINADELDLTIKQKALGRLRDVAIVKGGRLVSRKYLGAAAKHEWECSNGHRWQAIPSSVAPMATAKKGTWCPYCAGNSKLNLKEASEIAHKHGGECLSRNYHNMHTQMKWRCREGHQWLANFDSIKHNGSWCPRCSGRKSLEDCHQIASRKGGRFVSKTYVRETATLTWECGECLCRFRLSLKAVQGDRWCPRCHPPRDVASEVNVAVMERGGRVVSRSRHTESGVILPSVPMIGETPAFPLLE